ncbi:efflux RND transporter periplasmic adaptor subunit [Hyphomonas sp. NPDC076900]|jgi:cobalt-zinc-cadmium efflux system membrane fusion protein|uniref:Efflux transporter, RND family, MFP subunit n=2 Tax=Hyphomonas TaxID=85 RepID=Q0C1H2_HYPNA|nr:MULTISPECIES: efflux RND transporter periplasmic adaptor subunit [Hyphomonas]ABI78478.1 efflux transporter, RND family, MFP subunit [Hyphomonas neptunium ATCC 15444]KCZ92497.1 RND family efflux transporter MFP subunit [Hyphomonas hirschiana VP5]
MIDPKLTGLALVLAMTLAGCGGSGDTARADAAAVAGATTDEHADHDDHAEEEDGHSEEEGHADGEEEGHDDHDDHGDEANGDVVLLDKAAAAEAGIALSPAETGPLSETLSLPAELRFDADRVAQVAAPVSGLVSRLDKGEGDKVKRGERLAVLSSRELAGLKADFLTAKSAESLAASQFAREERLFADKITSQAELDAAQAALISARAEREAMENKLHAVGISDSVLERLGQAPDGSLANAALIAPLGGTVISRSVSIGSSVEAGGEALFIIVDDSQLWADIAVYKDDASAIETGQPVILRTRDGAEAARGKIALILPVISETTRTSTARVIVDNPESRLRPGQFVTAEISVGESGRTLHVPSDAIVVVEDKPSVFVPVEGGFAPRPVKPGRASAGLTEILDGLEQGERFVSAGAFTLKAQLEKDAFGDGHAH